MSAFDLCTALLQTPWHIWCEAVVARCITLLLLLYIMDAFNKGYNTILLGYITNIIYIKHCVPPRSFIIIYTQSVTHYLVNYPTKYVCYQFPIDVRLVLICVGKLNREYLWKSRIIVKPSIIYFYVCIVFYILILNTQ